MPDIQYRIFFDNKPAPRSQTDRIETITVEQELDMASEARLDIPISLDVQGRWTGIDESFMQSFARVRVEIMVGKPPFVSLIDGPVIGFNSPVTFEPGQSSITLLVQDDSVFLNRQDKVLQFENLADYEIARNLFGTFEQITSLDIEETPLAGSTSPPVIQRGTAMQLLRFLAHRQGMHAYVLPGDMPGQSVGNFKKFPKQADPADLLPPLIVLGPDRNVQGFEVRHDAQSPANVQASILRIADKQVVTRSASFRNLERLGEVAALPEGVVPASQILLPRQGESINLERAVQAQAEKSAYAFEATGSTLEECYSGVLRPYRLVLVKMGDTPVSGVYQITKVTHSLSRSVYAQSFALRRDATSARSSTNVPDMAGSIF